MTINNVIECLLCHGKAVLKKENFPGFQEPSVFTIYHCSDCETSFCVPHAVNTDKIYENIYKNPGFILGYDRYLNYSETVVHKKNPLKYLADTEDIYWGVCESLKKIAKTGKIESVFEVGSGLGYLTYALNKAGYQATGLDISREAVSKATEKYGNYYICDDLAEYALKHEGVYDVVICTEVIEHIVDPETFIKMLLLLVKPDGQVIVTTPNNSPFPDDIIWYTDLPPVHRWWFSEKSLLFLAKKIGFEADFIDFKKYYDRHLVQYSLVSRRNFDLVHSYFDRNDTPIVQETVEQPLVKRLLEKIPFVMSVYRRYVAGVVNPDVFICKHKGNVLCSILRKSGSGR
jgi:2-polyprenyl-3-methyl-5-hydroxy-6-metoxy-1,4-benzoquinol methylase